MFIWPIMAFGTIRDSRTPENLTLDSGVRIIIDSAVLGRVSPNVFWYFIRILYPVLSEISSVSEQSVHGQAGERISYVGTTKSSQDSSSGVEKNS
jgi:hypothetical protein